jgi:hypothetical protein
MNNPEVEYFGMKAISERYARRTEETVTPVPMGYPNWIKTTSTMQPQERWAFLSMLWIRKDIEAA